MKLEGLLRLTLVAGALCVAGAVCAAESTLDTATKVINTWKDKVTPAIAARDQSKLDSASNEANAALSKLTCDAATASQVQARVVAVSEPITKMVRGSSFGLIVDCRSQHLATQLFIKLAVAKSEEQERCDKVRREIRSIRGHASEQDYKDQISKLGCGEK